MSAATVCEAAYLVCALLFATFVDLTTVHDGYWADRLTKFLAALSWPAWVVLIAAVAARHTFTSAPTEDEQKG